MMKPAASYQIPDSIFLVSLALFILIFTSCYTPRYVYSPSAHNVPVMKQKGDAKLAASFATSLSTRNQGDNKSSGYDLQSAYATGKHLAFQLNYYHRNERNGGSFDIDNRDSSVIRYKRDLTEFGIGYYKTIGDRGMAWFQVFAGAGTGKFQFTDDGRDASFNYHSRFHKARVTRYFLQPAFMVNTKQHYTASLSSRFSLVRFHGIETSYSATEQDNYKLDSLTYKSHLFWEPAVINTFGFKKLPGVLLEVQAGFCFLASRTFIDSRPFNFSAGLFIDLPAMLKRNRKTGKKD